MRRFSRAAVARMSVALLIVTGASLGASSCHWLRYHDLARTHVDLLEQIADDVGAALDVVDYRMKPGDLQTMAYPLERAMAFVEESRRARAQLQSHQRLAAFVEAYKALYEYLDRVRSVRQEEGGTRTVNALIAVVNEHAAAVRAAIDEETG